jgi:hypothetical protein
MRFLLGVLVGYSMRGKTKLITILATVAFIVYIILPTIALLALRLDVQRERYSRPAQIRVPALKGLSYEDAETKLHISNLNIRLLATRYDLPLQPGLIIDQSPQPGEEVVYGYSVGVTIGLKSRALSVPPHRTTNHLNKAEKFGPSRLAVIERRV